MKPKISVVCPVYNRGTIIRHCIHGLLDQSFKDWEAIFVDDGSTDNTTQEIKRFAEADKRIKLYEIPHSGHIGKVRNHGNLKAKGELIVVQDSDDVSLPDRLQVIWEEYERTEADVIYHGVYWCFPFEKYQVTLREFKPAKPYDKQKLIESQYITAHIATKRSVALETPYDDEIYVCDDWMFLLDLALKDYKWHPISQGLYEYFYSPDSANIEGERSGKRELDMKRIIITLKDKYKIEVTGSQLIKRKHDIVKKTAYL